MKISFQQLIGPGTTQPLTESFSNALGVASSIGELNGLRLVSSGDTILCKQFHQACPQSRKACDYSRAVLNSHLSQGRPYALSKCRNGLNDAVTPIKVRGEHVANFYIGQFLYAPPDIPYFKHQARKYGFDETAYLKALEKVPVIEAEQIIRILHIVASITGILGELGLKHLEKMEASEKEIKLLQSLLPICSSCKKIKDDSGCWQQIEDYFHDRSGASFTHSICPDCCARLYGNETWYDEIEKLAPYDEE